VNEERGMGAVGFGGTYMYCCNGGCLCQGLQSARGVNGWYRRLISRW
jgi:hypothetical protein